MSTLPLPTYSYRGPIFDSEKLRYNPCCDWIFPSLIRVPDAVEARLGRYYLYYAPHDAPGGICLAFADSPDGPWTEHTANPIVKRVWPPHHEVSHISSPHVLWMAEESLFFLYYHGENDTTRLAVSRDGIHFDYAGVVVNTAMYDGISEASYARVFRCKYGSRAGEWALLFMGNHKGTRKIYAAWSNDGRKFTSDPKPLITPPPDTPVTQAGAPWYYPHEGRNFVIFHGDQTDAKLSDVITDLYLAEVGPGFDQETHLGLFYSRHAAGTDNQRVSDPFIFQENGREWLFLSVGPRLRQQIAVAIAE